jgi:hypothetical protein
MQFHAPGSFAASELSERRLPPLRSVLSLTARMETLKKVLICAAMLVVVGYFVLTYGLSHKVRGFKGVNTPGKSFTSGAPFEWLAVTNGETRQQLAHTLGVPTEQSGSTIDVWRKGKSTLRVTYDESGRATNVWMDGAWTLVVPFNENEQHTNAADQTNVK